jgi:hypothetical protein
LAIIWHFINDISIKLKKIHLKFLEVRHMYMSCDSVHSLISRKIDSDKYKYFPKHLIEIVKKSRNNNVQEITHKDFIIFDDKCVKSTKLKIFLISQVKKCEFLKDSYDIFVKFDHKKDYEKYHILKKNSKKI